MPAQESEVAEQLRLGRADDGRPTTDEEFASASYEEPWTYEQVGGRLVVMSPEGTGHVVQSMPWLGRLSAYWLANPDVVQVVVSQAWLRIDANTSRTGDIGVYLGGTLESIKIPHQVPDLMFEFVSPSATDRRRDYVDKRADYHRVGVREYVIVDRFDRKVTVLTLVEQGYQEVVLTDQDRYESPLLPGFSVRLAEVLPR